MNLSYDRPEHIRYINDLKRKGLYSEFEQEAKNCKKALREIYAKLRVNYPTHALFVNFHPVIDEDPVDHCYYIDIGAFLVNNFKSTFNVKDFLDPLVECIQTKYNVPVTGVYYNETMKAFMFTISAIIDPNGPNMYSSDRVTVR